MTLVAAVLCKQNERQQKMNAEKYFCPFVPLVLSMMAGILLGAWMPAHSLLALAIILLCTGLVVRNLTRKSAAFFIPIVLFGSLGYLSIQSWMTPDLSDNHITHFANSRTRKFIGVVETSPIAGYHRKRFILRTVSIREGNAWISVCGKIRVTVVGPSNRLSKGDRLCLTAKVKHIENFNNPGGFDYKRYMLFKRVMVTAYVSRKNLSILAKASKSTCLGTIADGRGKISDLIENTLRPGPAEEVLKALIIGDRFAVSETLRQSFNRAGVGHLLAISGLHVGIVATVSFLFFQKLLANFRYFLWHAWTKKGAALLSFTPIWIYGLLAGMSPSTQRAVIMVSVFLMTFLFESEHDAVNTLAFAAMVILVASPPALFAISFQLSFSAVFAILYGHSRIRKSWLAKLTRAKTTAGFRIAGKLFYFFLASLFATLGTLPLLMFYFNQISLVGLLANMVIVPLIGFVVVPLGLFAVFLFPLTVTGASFCLYICSIVLTPTLKMVLAIGRLPCAAVKTVTPTVLEIGCYYILLWVILNWRQHRYLVFIAVLAVLVLSADTCYWCCQRFWHDDLRISIIDVGHGSAALLELPEGYTMLIDGGGFADNSVFNVGARIVAPFLWRKKINTVDTLVLSHPNSDHVNGLVYIAAHFHVKNLWFNHQNSKNVGYRDLLRAARENEIDMPTYKDIFGRHWISGVCLDVFYPPVDFIDRQRRDRWRDANNNSLVVKITFGAKSVLFPGDIEARAEAALVAAAGADIASTVLVAPHHGSRTSSSPVFIEKVSPNAVVVSAGRRGRFELPHPSVVKRYRQNGCRVFATNRHGAITLTTDGRTLAIKTTLAGDN